MTVPPVWITSAATIPLLATLVAEQLLSEGLIQIGLASEEVFRGVRLPLLKAPHIQDTCDSAMVSDDTSDGDT